MERILFGWFASRPAVDDGLVGPPGGEGKPGVIVDGDVQVLPTCPAHLLAPVAVDAMVGLDDAGQTLDVEVDQIAGVLVLIAHDRRRRIKRTQPVHAGPADDTADGGSAEPGLADYTPTVVAQPAKSKNLF